MSEYRRIETENPLLDEIIYNCKVLIQDLVIKDENKANTFETPETAGAFDTYLAIIQGRIKMYYFDITTEDIMTACPHLTFEQVRKYIVKLTDMSYDDYNALLQYKVSQFLETYEERNEYYRLICGMPALDQPDLYLTKHDIEDIIVTIDITKPVHQFNEIEKSAIISAGILDNLIEKYPQYEYLKYLGKGINNVTARLAPKFDLLYISTDAEPTIIAKFKELYAVNRMYITNVTDYQAEKYYSVLYDRFLMMDIVVNTVSDMIHEFPEFIINREVFDLRTAKYFFESFGVVFYEEIPIKYQKRLIRSLNRLIKWKGTDKVIKTIAAIFGFENIEIFKYYLYKFHKPSSDKELSKEVDIGDIHYTIDGYKETDNPLQKYELHFVRVPLDGLVNDYLKDDSCILSYENTISDDMYWNADKKAEQIKKEIAEMDFNTVKSKYISINTMHSLTETSFQVSYFINMVMCYGIKQDALILNVPGIDNRNSSFTLFDTLTFIYALTYLYIDLDPAEETICTDSMKLLGVHGFNLYEDLTALSSEIYTMMKNLIKSEAIFSQYPDGTYMTDVYTIDQVIQDIENGSYENKKYGMWADTYISIVLNVFHKYKFFEKNKAPSIAQLVDTFIGNKEVYDFIEYNMVHAEDLYMHDIFTKLYDSLMVIDINNDLYKITKNGKTTVAKSYIEYLQFANPRYYGAVMKLYAQKGTKTYKSNLFTMISKVCNIVLQYINSEELEDIFIDIPTDNSDFLKKYMVKIIEFFMSFKVAILNMQTIYTLKPEANRPLDSFAIINALYYPEDYASFIDSCAIESQYTLKPDRMSPEDDIIVTPYYEPKED